MLGTHVDVIRVAVDECLRDAAVQQIFNECGTETVGGEMLRVSCITGNVFSIASTPQTRRRYSKPEPSASSATRPGDWALVQEAHWAVTVTLETAGHGRGVQSLTQRSRAGHLVLALRHESILFLCAYIAHRKYYWTTEPFCNIRSRHVNRCLVDVRGIEQVTSRTAG